jgi:hypothetical protein
MRFLGFIVGLLGGLFLTISISFAQATPELAESDVTITYSFDQNSSILVTTNVKLRAKTSANTDFPVVELNAAFLKVSDSQGNPLSFAPLATANVPNLPLHLQSLYKAKQPSRQVLEVALPLALQMGDEFSYQISYSLPPVTNVAAQAPFYSSSITNPVRLLNNQRADFSIKAFGDKANIKVQLPPNWSAFARNSGLVNANLIANNSVLQGSISGVSNSLNWRAEIEATALGTTTAYKQTITIPANGNLALGSRPLNLELYYWDYDKTEQEAVINQLQMFIPVFERLTGVAYPGGTDLVIRQVSGAGVGLSLTGFNYSANSLSFGANGSKQTAQILIAQPGLVQSAQLANALAQLWSEKSGFSSGWVREGISIVLAQRSLKTVNLAFVPDGEYKNAVLRWSNTITNTTQSGASLPVGIDRWQPLPMLEGLSANDTERELLQYQASAGLIIDLANLTEAQDDFFPRLFRPSLEYSRYFPRIGSRELMDVLEDNFNRERKLPGFNDALDSLFRTKILNTSDANLVSTRRKWQDEVHSFFHSPNNQATTAGIAPSARLKRLLGEWNFEAASGELASADRLLDHLLNLETAQKKLSVIKLPPRLPELLSGIKNRSDNLSLPDNPRSNDVYGYGDVLKLAGYSDTAAKNLVATQAYLSDLLRKGYLTNSEKYTQVYRLYQEALTVLAKGNPQEASDLCSQALERSVPIGDSEVIKSNTYSVPNATDLWRTLVIGVAALMTIVLFGALLFVMARVGLQLRKRPR